jgi:hypothetical protein
MLLLSHEFAEIASFISSPILAKSGLPGEDILVGMELNSTLKMKPLGRLLLKLYKLS